MEDSGPSQLAEDVVREGGVEAAAMDTWYGAPSACAAWIDPDNGP